MSVLQVSLFGQLCVECQTRSINGFDSCKTQELFSYLLIHRDRAHSRDSLAALLWQDNSLAQARSYLRKTLWQLHNVLGDSLTGPAKNLLEADNNAIQLNSSAGLWLDVAVFEEAYNQTLSLSGRDLHEDQAQNLRRAIALYQGELLNGWYQDWCLFERERFQHMYLVMLDKLLHYCELQGDYEAGIEYGLRILRCDTARERTHRCLMRLHYLSDNRTEALRQYERCADVLRKELNVAPGKRTRALLQKIQADLPLAPATLTFDAETAVLHQDRLNQLKELQTLLTNLAAQTRQEIAYLESAPPPNS